jgi:hypothetical protein
MYVYIYVYIYMRIQRGVACSNSPTLLRRTILDSSMSDGKKVSESVHDISSESLHDISLRMCDFEEVHAGVVDDLCCIGLDAQEVFRHAAVCCRMLTYADVC